MAKDITSGNNKGEDNKEIQAKKKKPIVPPPPPPPEDEKKKEEIKKRKARELRPFMQVDGSKNIVFNFLSNFLRQFNNPTRTGLFAKLFRSRHPEQKPQPARFEGIMGTAKTVFEDGRAKPQYGGAPKNDSQSAKQNMHQSEGNTARQKNETQPKVIPLNEPKKRGLRR